MNNWLPKSVLCLKSYTKRLFLADLLSGITVGLVALPLTMAFAIGSGVPPEAGLYCAIVAGFVISAIGRILAKCHEINKKFCIRSIA